MGLCAELQAFARFMSLRPSEQGLRDEAVKQVERFVTAAFPHARVFVYGSSAYDVALPGSIVDLMAENCGDLRVMASQTTPPGLSIGAVHLNNESPDGPPPSAAFMSTYFKGLGVNLAMVTGESSARGATDMCREWLEKYPAAGRVALLVKYLLRQAKYEDVRLGGLSSYCVLMMCVYICKREEHPDDDSAVFVGFLQEFGFDFSYATEAVCVATGTKLARSPAHGSHSFVIEDPQNPGNNLASGLTRLTCVRSQFQYCCRALQRWGHCSGMAGPRRGGYKGRTPLSALISHRDLWQRREEAELEGCPVHDDDEPPPLC